MVNKNINGKKGQVVIIYLVFIVLTIIILFIAAFFAPMAVKVNTEIYAAGEQLLLSANDSIASISDTNVRENVRGSIENALDATEYNIELNANMFKYSWLFVVGIGALILFITARLTTETQRTRGGVI